MASSNSISIVEASPKARLPTKNSILAEANACRLKVFDSTDNSPSNLQKVVAELVGTYILIFVGCGSILTDKVLKLTMVGIALAWGGVLVALIYTVGHISGAHFNPAVTVAFAAGRKFSWKHVPMYVLAQLLGATLASLTLRVLFNGEANLKAAVNGYSNPTSDLEAITWEFIITFILMFAICGTASDHRASKDLAGVAIGATLTVNALLAGPITGASMNPARSLGPAIVSGVYKKIWVFIIAPTLGALAAVLVYSILRVPKQETAEESIKSTFNRVPV